MSVRCIPLERKEIILTQLKNLYKLYIEENGNYYILQYKQKHKTITIGEMERYWWLDFLKPGVEMNTIFNTNNY